MNAPSNSSGSTARQPVLLEIGARFGLREQPWAEVVDNGQVRCYLIEPDPEECQRLERKHPLALVRQVALGSTAGTLPFYVTRHPACASLRKPNWELLERYEIKSWFEIEREYDVYVQRTDELIQQGVLEQPDYVHVDVQGFELEVLKGVGEFLRNVTGLKLELHPVPLYQGETSMFEVGSWLANLGFQLVGLQQQGPYEGDFVEANCFFINRGLPQTEAAKKLAEFFIERHEIRSADQPNRDIAHVHRRLREVEKEKLMSASDRAAHITQ
jgi:FkbM family methyltransferase